MALDHRARRLRCRLCLLQRARRPRRPRRVFSAARRARLPHPQQLPYAPGHLMAVINRHTGALLEAGQLELSGRHAAWCSGRWSAHGRVPARRLQRRAQPGAVGRCRHRRPPAHPRGAALERRLQLPPASSSDTRVLPEHARRKPGSACGDASVADVTATPMMTQYRELKRRFPDHLLLFRLGDFYELFLEDAELGRAPAVRSRSRPARARRWPAFRITRRMATSPGWCRPARRSRSASSSRARARARSSLRARRRAGDHARHAHRHRRTLAARRTTSSLALGRTGASTGIALLGRLHRRVLGRAKTAPARTRVLAAAPCCAARPRPSCRTRCGRRRSCWPGCRPPGATLTFADPGLWSGRRRRDGALPPLQCDDARGLRRGRPCGRAAGGGRGARLRAGHAGRARSATWCGSSACVRPTRMTLDADRGAHARAARGQRRDGAQLALRRARRDQSTPMGARLLRQWLLQPLLDRGGDRAPVRMRSARARRRARDARAALRRLLQAGRRSRAASRAGPRSASRTRATSSGCARCLGPLAAVREAHGRRWRRRCWRSARGAGRRSTTSQAMLADALVDEPPLALQDGRIIRESWSDALRRARQRRRRGARAGSPALEERERRAHGTSRASACGFNSRLRLRHRGDPRPGRARARRVRAAADADRRRALHHARAEGVRGQGPGRRGAAAAAQYELFDGRCAAAWRRGRPTCWRTARAVATLDVVRRRWPRSPTRAGHVRPLVDDSAASRHRRGTPSGARGALRAAGHAQRPRRSTREARIDDPHRARTWPASRSISARPAHLVDPGPHRRVRAGAVGARSALVDRVFTRVGAQDNLARGPVDVPRGDGGDRRDPAQRHRRAAWCCSTRSGAGRPTFDGLAIAWAVVEELHDRAAAARRCSSPRTSTS